MKMLIRVLGTIPIFQAAITGQIMMVLISFMDLNKTSQAVMALAILLTWTLVEAQVPWITIH